MLQNTQKCVKVCINIQCPTVLHIYIFYEDMFTTDIKLSIIHRTQYLKDKIIYLMSKIIGKSM